MAGEGVPVSWQTIDISEGRLTAENSEGLKISVFADFSGVLFFPSGNTAQFEDLRTLIDTGKFLEQILVERYGGYK